MLGKALLAAAVSLAAPIVSQAAERPARPNIVYILADDLGYADLGCYGQTKIRTPNLDRMAAEGMRFTNHYATPCCAPTRCVLLTGKHLGHARVRNNGFARNQKLAPEDVTFANVLQDAGYETACIGKWGLGFFNDSGNPLTKGFDHFYGFLSQTRAHAQYPPYLDRDGKRIKIAANADQKRGLYAHDSFTAEAMAFIAAKRAEPFMLYLAYTLPHAELLVPEDSLKAYAGQWPETPFADRNFAAQTQPRAARAAMISRMDRDIGRLLDSLKELGLEENTLVMFASDNGPAVAGGSDPAFFQSTGDLSGVKFTLAEGGIRVPFVARWPGRIQAGSTSDLVCAVQDMFPTFAELAGVPVPADVDGVSILPTLLGRDKEQAQREYLYWEFAGGQAVRMGNYKAMRKSPGEPVQVFDLKSDPGEKVDIAASRRALVERATGYMAAAHVEDAEWPLEQPAVVGK